MKPSSRGKKGCGCLPLIGVFFLVGFAGSYLFFRNFLGDELSFSQAAEIIPEEAIMTSFISTNSQDWSKLTEFATPQTKEVINKSWQEFQQEITQDNYNIDYKQDIQPWLGGILLTILPSPKAGFDYDLVMIAGIKNKFKAGNFIRKLEKKSDIKTEATKYQNITIYEYQNDQNDPFWVTQFKNYLVVANQKYSLEEIIDTFKGENSLANQQKFSDALAQKVNLKNPVMQVYFADYDRLIQNAIKSLISSQNKQFKSQEELTKINSMMMAMGIEDNGIHFQAVVDLKNTLDLAQLKPLSNNLIKQFPQDTILMINGRGINQAWEEIDQQKRLIPELDDLINNGQVLANEWFNLNLEKDVVSWMNGEFAMGLLPLENTSFANNIFGGLLLLETNNRPQAEKFIGKIENFSNSIPWATIQRKNIQGITVTEWKTLPSFLFSYGWFRNDSLMMTIATDFKTINDLNNKASLVNNKTFKLTTQSLPKNNLGYFYFDIDKTFSFVNQNMGHNLNMSAEAQVIVDSLEAIAMTTSNLNPQTSQIDLFISLKKDK